MNIVTTVLMVALASIPAGWITGQSWLVGNRAASMGVFWLVIFAIFSNLMIALIYYYLLRGAVHQAGGGIGLYVALAAINLVISIGVASWTAGAIGAGDVVKLGAHAFSWGMSCGYGQVIHDVRHDTWLHH